MKMDRPFKRAAPVATVILSLICCCGCARVVSAPLMLPERELAPADVIVTLGYGPPVDRKGTPSPELARRVEKAAELYHQGLAPWLIMTGGNTYRHYYESEVMKELAVSLGVPAAAVIEERQARDTIGNAGYSAKIMAERGFTSAILVSSPYHLKRGKMLFEMAGVEVQTAAAEVPDNPFYGAVFSLYEYLVRLDYRRFDVEAALRDKLGPGSANLKEPEVE